MFIDPHEIANVLGLPGVRLMHDEAATLPINVYVQMPSCVPSAPGLETPGAAIGPEDVAEAMTWPGIIGLGEMMNFPGVFSGDDKMHAEMAATMRAGKIIGGHYAARAVAFEKRIKACLSLSGPYSWLEIFDHRNELSREAFRVRSHSRTMEEAREVAKTLTLAGVAKNITCPIYIVAGTKDRLTPVEAAKQLAAEVSGPCVLSIIEGGNHVVNNYWYRYRDQTADWMATQLGVPKL